MSPEILVEARGLSKHYPLRRGWSGWGRSAVPAVDGVDLEIGRGETLGVVGESGSGKSTLGRLLLGLVEPTSGSVRFEGSDLMALSSGELRRRRRRMQIVFQDPYGSLDPFHRVGDSIAEPLRIFRVGDRRQREARVGELLELVGLRPEDAQLYPHEFSGGQRQRISIARALALAPSFVVCDEPVSSLDVSVQGQIVNLLRDLQASLGLTYLFVSHDLAIVRHVADRVMVMYLGRIVEAGTQSQICGAPLHPYTRALFAAMPVPDPERLAPPVIEVENLGPARPSQGCHYAARCPLVQDRCRQAEPHLRDPGDGRRVACHLVP
jgi:peptide/nickel transport system ATP-binding protein/oligopeptide transport system ATP-binding protein